MAEIYNWGIDLILWLQQASPALDLPFQFITFFGQKPFYVIFIPLLYWCLDNLMGMRLTYLLMISAYVGNGAKLTFHQPRPFQYDPRVKMLEYQGDYGFPSLHTINAVLIPGYLAALIQRRWMYVLAILALILIPFSRLYLGVHFPTDLLGGYLIGAVLLWLSVKYLPRAAAWVAQNPLVWQLTLALLVPLLLLSLFRDQNSLEIVGMLAGVGEGMILERKWIKFKISGALWQRMLRFMLGMLVFYLLFLLFKFLFAPVLSQIAFLFCRAVLIGLWLSLGAPWLFIKLKLARSDYS